VATPTGKPLPPHNPPIDVKRDGILYRQRYERGVAVTPLLEVDLVEEDDSGTITSFLPDLEVMETRDYNFDILASVSAKWPT